MSSFLTTILIVVCSIYSNYLRLVVAQLSVLGLPLTRMADALRSLGSWVVLSLAVFRPVSDHSFVWTAWRRCWHQYVVIWSKNAVIALVALIALVVLVTGVILGIEVHSRHTPQFTIYAASYSLVVVPAASVLRALTFLLLTLYFNFIIVLRDLICTLATFGNF